MKYIAGIMNAYDWRNRGDRAIVEAQMAWIRTRIPNVEFRVFSACWEENRKAFGADTSFPPPVAVKLGSGKLGGVISPLKGWANAVGNKASGKAWEEFQSCDGYFLCGGGYLYSSHSPLISRQLWLHVANSLVALKSGKPVMQFPQSWGPFRKRADRWISRRLASGLSRIVARGIISEETISAMGFSNKTLNLPDVVLAMRSLRPEIFQNQQDETKQGLGIAPIEFGFARSCDESQRASYLGKLHAIALRFHRETGQTVNLFIQVSVTGHDDDAPMAQRLAALLESSGVPVSIRNNPDWIKHWSEIGSQSCFIGCRMHACIFAMVAGVPTVGLAYQPKFIELFTELGSAEKCFDISDFDPDAVANTILDPSFTSTRNISNLSKAVDASAAAMLVGLEECWNEAGFPRP